MVRPENWRRGEHNQIADYLANRAMDERRSFSDEYEWPFPGMALNRCNFIAHSDGGSRLDCSASAWVIEVGVWVGAAWEYRVLARAGTFFERRISSFAAECIALEACVTRMKAFLVT